MFQVILYTTLALITLFSSLAAQEADALEFVAPIHDGRPLSQILQDDPTICSSAVRHIASYTWRGRFDEHERPILEFLPP